jgi:hypothetical protein
MPTRVTRNVTARSDEPSGFRIPLTIGSRYVLDTFVPAAPTTAALPNHPAPTAGSAADGAPAYARDDGAPIHVRSDSASAQSHAGRVLGLLRKLIEYGQDLARTVQQGAVAATLFTVAVHFGTRDMALILARITRGLRLAAALEERLVSRAVRTDTAPASVRVSHDRVTDALSDPAKRAARRIAKRSPLPDVPTAEEIAAALRYRPAAAVIADICRDLGIVPAHPLWREVMTVLCDHGGNVMTFFKDTMVRLFRSLAAATAGDAEGWPALRPQPAAAVCGTGPP